MPGLLDWPFVSFEFRLHDLYTLLKAQGGLLEAMASAHRRMPRVHLWFSSARTSTAPFRWSTGPDLNRREDSLSDLQSDAFDRSATCAKCHRRPAILMERAGSVAGVLNL